MMRVIIVWALMLIALVLIFVPLYSIKDSHYGVSNVCNELLYPNTCGSNSKRTEN